MKKLTVLILVVLMVFGLTSNIVMAQENVTLTVDGSLVENDLENGMYKTIQEAVLAAEEGATIQIIDGNYTIGNLELTKPLTLVGSQGVEVTGKFILASSDITLEGFQLHNPNGSGIEGKNGIVANNITIKNMTLSNISEWPIKYGLGTGDQAATNWEIIGNEIYDIIGNDKTAIILQNIDGLKILNNTITHNNQDFVGRRGMNLDGVRNVLVNNNEIDMGLTVDASDLGLHWSNTWTPARYTIQIAMSDRSAEHIVIKNNLLKNAYDGIITLSHGDAKDITIQNNEFINMTHGIRFYAGSGNVNVSIQTDLMIKGNDFFQVGYGIRFGNSNVDRKSVV